MRSCVISLPSPLGGIGGATRSGVGAFHAMALSAREVWPMAKRRKKKWMQKTAKSIKKRGTAGVFKRWCSTHGFGSKVTTACVAAGKRSRSAVTRKRAALAGTYLKASRSRKRKKR